MLLKSLKRGALSLIRAAGGFSLALNSDWRSERLLILCYHGISQDDEHQWDPELYMPVEMFTRRMEGLRDRRCRVLPLREGLARLRVGTLPPRSVCLTFDDGFFNFYSRAAPVLDSFGYPATVYLTTYYCGLNLPVFPLVCSYLIWKGARRAERSDPRSKLERALRVNEIHKLAVARKLSAGERDKLAAELAAGMGVEYGSFKKSRVLQLMNSAEVREVAERGTDIELHTHRHRTPPIEAEFAREIADNRVRIHQLSGTEASEFCYPNGNHRPEFSQWLRQLGVGSATTCNPGLACRTDDMLLLPRLVDTCGLSDVEFESWVAGIGAMLPRLRSSEGEILVPIQKGRSAKATPHGILE